MKLVMFFLCFNVLQLVQAQNKLDEKGKKQGDWVKTYPNSKSIEFKGQFKDDLKEGEWFEYFESGILSKKLNYKNGKLTGEYIDYYNDGRIEEKGQYLNDLKVGIWRVYFYYKDEVFESVGTFNDGIKSEDWQTYKLKNLDN